MGSKTAKKIVDEIEAYLSAMSVSDKPVNVIRVYREDMEVLRKSILRKNSLVPNLRVDEEGVFYKRYEVVSK